MNATFAIITIGFATIMWVLYTYTHDLQIKHAALQAENDTYKKVCKMLLEKLVERYDDDDLESVADDDYDADSDSPADDADSDSPADDDSEDPSI